MSVCVSLRSCMWAVCSGICNSASSLVGNSIGAGDVPLAKRYYHLNMGFSILLFLLVSLLMYVWREESIRLLSHDNLEILDTSSRLMAFICLEVIIDGIMQVQQGMVRALSMPKLVSAVAFPAAWIIGVPLAAILALKYEYSVFGLFMGKLASSVFSAIGYQLCLFLSDWKAISAEAMQRMSEDKVNKTKDIR